MGCARRVHATLGPGFLESAYGDAMEIEFKKSGGYETRRSRMLNADVDVNDFAPVTFDEMVANNRAFIACHSEEEKQNPLAMFCLEA